MFPTYSVSSRHRAPLVEYMVDALRASGCRILRCSEPDRAPFRITFETAMGERMGIVAYAFFANTRETRNRPQDEHRFQIKYGSDFESLHEIWQDPWELYTTLLIGIDPERGLWVAADPVLHNPTRFSVSVEFKEADVEAILQAGWHAWEREKRRSDELPIEVLVGGTADTLLRGVRFEQAAKGLDPGHRQLLAEKLAKDPTLAGKPGPAPAPHVSVPHSLVEEFDLTQAEILDLIQSAPRLKMAVRGWVAEEHLLQQLQALPGVEDCVRIEEEGKADIRLRYRGSDRFEIECKNVLRQRRADGTMVLDFQKTRASKADPCSRFYSPQDFSLVAACLHSCTEQWEFRYALTRQLDPHKTCEGKLHHRIEVGERWTPDALAALASASRTPS